MKKDVDKIKLVMKKNNVKFLILNKNNSSWEKNKSSCSIMIVHGLGKTEAWV